MQLRIGQSRCEICGALVDTTDDLFVVKPWKGLEAIVGCRAGFYHYECFQSSAFASAYVQLNADQWNERLDRADKHAVTLQRTEEFALIHRPLAEQFTLYFLREGRTIGQLDGQRLTEILEAVAQEQETESVEVVQREDGVSLLFPETVPVSIELAREDYEKLMDVLPKLDEKSDDLVDLGAVLVDRGITPVSSGCRLSRAQGTITSVEPLAASGSSYVDLEVARHTEVRLPAAEFQRLREFASQALARLANLD